MMHHKTPPYSNLKKKFAITACLLSTLFLSACASNVNTRLEHIVPRESFVKIIAVVEAEMCAEISDGEGKKEKICKTRTMKAFASGVIVKRDERGSEILTAGHVCDTSDLTGGAVEGVEFKISILAMATNGERFNSVVKRIDTSIDCCLLLAEDMNRWKPIRIRTSPPEYAEKLYNMASPLGVATPDMLPLLEGRYSGDVNFRRSAYTIPAAPGSSGSPIFDKRGKLIGMIHSVYIRFPFLSFGPTHEKLLEFLDH